MILDLTDDETVALLNLLIDTIEAERYPMSPRIRLLQQILAKCGEIGGLPPELCASAGPEVDHSRITHLSFGEVPARPIILG
jgi:hypothetical protein